MLRLSEAPPTVVQKSGRSIPAPEFAPAYLVITVVSWTIGLVLAVLVATKTSALIDSDRQFGEWFDTLGLNAVGLREAALGWHYLGGPVGTFTLMAVATMWLLAIRRPWWALYLVVCAIGGLVIAEIVKHVIARPRPVWPDPTVVESGGSFPSGHSMGGIYAWTMVGVVLIYLLKRPIGTVLGWVFIVFGVLMAPSRLLLGVHWPSDVLAGWLFATGWVLLVTAVAVLLVAKHSVKTATKEPPEPTVKHPT